jgi:putative sigma-54 modulation protein
MQIEFVARHVELGDGLRREIERRLAGVRRLLKEPIEVRVVLESTAGEKHRYGTELHVTHRGGALRAHAESPELIESVAAAAAAIVEQARRGRERRVDRRRRGGREAAKRHWPVEVLAEGSVGNGGKKEVVRSSRLEIEPMSLAEAARRLERSRNEFYVFLDSESERLSVLYRRHDDRYGLISPEF